MESVQQMARLAVPISRSVESLTEGLCFITSVIFFFTYYIRAFLLITEKISSQWGMQLQPAGDAEQ